MRPGASPSPTTRRRSARTSASERPTSARRSLLVVAALVAAAALPAVGRASHWQPGACGLPASFPLRVEYSEVGVSPVIRNEIFAAARPPLVLATSGARVPAELRAGGAHTVYWYMKMVRLVGRTAEPADPATIVPAAARLVARAAAESGCATPIIALNELHGAWKPTPWTPTYAQYRANVLELLRALHAMGAHPYLLLPTTPRPFTQSPEAVAWWLETAAVSDLVLQLHFSAPFIASLGVIPASHRRRTRMREAIAQFEAIGVPWQRIGLLHGFQSNHGGRGGLRLDKWLRVVKWESLALKHVVGERQASGTPLASDWSWGWADFPTLGPIDPDKPLIACIWLWVREPTLCDAPTRTLTAGAYFNASLTEGQLVLPPGVQCTVGRPRGAIYASEVERLAAARSDTGAPLGRRASLATLFVRVVDRMRAVARPSEVTRAENALVARRFGGAWQDYEAALADANLTYADARAVIGDQVRARKIAAQLRSLRISVRRWRAGAAKRALRTTTCLADVLPSPSAQRDLSLRFGFLRMS